MRLSNFHFTFYISWHVTIVRENGSHFPHDTYKLLHFENFNSKFQQILFLTWKKCIFAALNLKINEL